ncbi:MerR family transcriptional regulator [Rudaeicoccus suwonensis]|uniref:transcriptional regulator FtsR n=1 Tax=Rudaeicoccus suwonensis TaxID=657409 RepID=UPI001FEAF473|nr:MerR family transcriptional regulator [Rudaeicoccus suwonensis]
MTDAGFTIGAVLDRLRPDFPDLTLSKIRFLDSQDLVSPERTRSRYRRYSERDIDRLRFVLTCQREKYWPLKVIREALDAYDRGLRPAGDDDGLPQAPATTPDPDLPTDVDLGSPDRSVRLTRAELQRACGLDRADLADLESFGLVTEGDDGLFSTSDLQVAEAAAGLLAYGVQARHLRPFRLAAEREVALVQGLTAGPGRADQSEVVRQCLALHLALVRSGVTRG